MSAFVGTGALVRLSGSGLGCSDWPNCTDQRLVQFGDTNQTIEQVNRLFTGLVSIAVIAAVLGSLRRRPYRRDLVWLSCGLVAGVLAQIVLGGITVVLYGMIGLLGAKIWKENNVDFANPINLVPVAAGIILGIGNTALKVSDTFELAGIALGTIVTIAAYHLARAFAHADLRAAHDGGAMLTVGHEGIDKVK